jgi:hypothetical protein
MKYVLLIHGNEAEMMSMTPEQQAAQMGAYLAYTQDAVKEGVFDSGEALMPSAMSTTVRVKGGKTVTTDGPFAETKEQVAGYYVLECKDLNQAIEWAARISAIDGSVIEVRPVMVIGAGDPRPQ